jgi:hypothetical protein
MLIVYLTYVNYQQRPFSSSSPTGSAIMMLRILGQQYRQRRAGKQAG